MVQKLELPPRRHPPRRPARDGIHGEGLLVLHRPGEHARDRLERDAVRHAEPLVIKHLHRRGPVQVRRSFSQGVNRVVVVPGSRAQRRGAGRRDAHGVGQRRQRLAALHHVQRAVRAREDPDEPREFPFLHRRHEPHDLLHVLLARGARVPELLDHHRGARAGRQAADDIAAGVPHGARDA